MKNLIFINGTMGAGKSAVSRELKKILAPSFFLDGDWCWDMEPFVPGAAERALVLRNIAFLLNISRLRRARQCYFLLGDAQARRCRGFAGAAGFIGREIFSFYARRFGGGAYAQAFARR